MVTICICIHIYPPGQWSSIAKANALACLIFTAHGTLSLNHFSDLPYVPTCALEDSMRGRCTALTEHNRPTYSFSYHIHIYTQYVLHMYICIVYNTKFPMAAMEHSSLVSSSVRGHFCGKSGHADI